MLLLLTPRAWFWFWFNRAAIQHSICARIDSIRLALRSFCCGIRAVVMLGWSSFIDENSLSHQMLRGSSLLEQVPDMFHADCFVTLRYAKLNLVLTVFAFESF